MVDKVRKIRYSIKAFKREKDFGWSNTQAAQETPLLRAQAGKPARGFKSLLLRHLFWPVGETVNSHAFHACIHGFESRTGHQYWYETLFSPLGRAFLLILLTLLILFESWKTTAWLTFLQKFCLIKNLCAHK